MSLCPSLWLTYAMWSVLFSPCLVSTNYWSSILFSQSLTCCLSECSCHVAAGTAARCDCSSSRHLHALLVTSDRYKRFVTQVEQLGGAPCVMNTPLTHIPHPPSSDPNVTLHALGQAALQRQKMNPLFKMQSTGDAVNSFGEAAAAGGFLGRFPGSAIMPLVQQFIGMNTH